MSTRPDVQQQDPVPVYLAQDNRYRAVDTATNFVLGLFNGALITVACLPLLIALVFVVAFLEESFGIPSDVSLLVALITAVAWLTSRRASRR